MRNTFIDTIISAGKTRDDIFFISGDAGLGVFDDFKVQYPDKFVNLGITEQNMASMAAGMALTGHRVVMYNIIPFLLYRCYEQVRNDICYQELPVILAGIGSGLTYSPQGMTHYSVEDIALARTLPNLTVISPIDPIEAKLAAEYALQSKLPVYVRLAKRGEPNFHKKENFDITKPQVLIEGEEIAILFHGSISLEVVKAAEILEGNGIKPLLVSVPFVQPLDHEALSGVLKGIRAVVTVEEHFYSTGLGSIIMDHMFRNMPGCKLVTLGVENNYIHDVLDNAGMRKHFGIDAASIAKTVTRLKEEL